MSRCYEIDFDDCNDLAEMLGTSLGKVGGTIVTDPYSKSVRVIFHNPKKGVQGVEITPDWHLYSEEIYYFTKIFSNEDDIYNDDIESNYWFEEQIIGVIHNIIEDNTKVKKSW